MADRNKSPDFSTRSEFLVGTSIGNTEKVLGAHEDEIPIVGATVANANSNANAANAYNSGYAAGSYNTGYAMGAIYPTTPAGCVQQNVDGTTYYFYSNTNTWFQPSFGANGVYYRVVPPPV